MNDLEDGFCYIQLVLVDGAASGHASSTQFGTAALTIIRQCVVKYGYGGFASKFGESNNQDLPTKTKSYTCATGGDNNLDVIVSSYKPNVKCNQAAAPPWSSTVAIFAGMPATKTLVVFGRTGTGVDLPIPYFLKAGKSTHQSCDFFDGYN